MNPGTGRIFYGWFALAGAMLAIFFVAGAFLASFGVFLPVMCHEFGWGRASLASALSLGQLAFGLPSMLWGFLVTRFGPRINIVLGNLLAALALAGLSLVQEVWHVYLLYILVGLGAGLGLFIAGTTVVNNWFIRRRSLAMGMFLAAGSVGHIAYPPMATALIASIGWRLSWLVLAGMALIGAVLLGGVFLVRNRPEDMGQLPDGVSAETFMPAEMTENPLEMQVKGQMKRVLQMPTTKLIIAFASANNFVLGTVTAHQIAYVQDLGFAPMIAAMTFSLWAVASCIGSLVFGALALNFNVRYLASAAFLVQMIALGILVSTRELALLYAYSALIGFGSGALITAMPTFVGAYYGRALYSQVVGIIFSFQVVAVAVAPAIVGAVYDTTATYSPAFYALVAICAVGLVCVYLVRQQKESSQKK